MAKKVAKKAPSSGKGGDDTTATIEEIPSFVDDDGVLKKLKRSDFPSSVEGQQGFCDYQIARWEDKKKRIAERNDPKAKAKRKLEKYKKLIAQLEAEIEDEDEE